MNEQQQSTGERPKFACDRTLGRLAKWLRILGYDTIYWNNLDDESLIKSCGIDDRILLTRNTAILKRIGKLECKNRPDFCFITRNDFRDQLKDVMRQYTLDPENKLRLCSGCNAEFTDIDKDKVEGHVPDYVFETQSVFKKCTECGKYFWQGTHVGRMLDHLGEL